MVATSPDGEIYLLGTLGASSSLIKLSAAGDTIWTASYPGIHPAALALQESSAIVVVASSTTTIQLSDYVTLRYSADGDLDWARSHDVGMDTPAAVAVSASGIISVTGSSLDGTYDGDIVTITYDSDGDELWTARYDGPSHGDDGPAAIVFDQAGNALITGHSAGGCTTLKYDPVGALVWSRNEPALLRGECILLDAAGGPLVASNADGGASLVQYSSAGVTAWTADVAGINPVGLVRDSDGNLYTATTLYDPEPEWRVSKIGPLGAVVWDIEVAGPPGSRDLASAIALSDGALYVAGQWSNADEHYMLARVALDGSVEWTVPYDGPGSGFDGSLPDGALAAVGTGVCLLTSESTVGGLLDWIVRKVTPGGAEVWSRSFSGMRDPVSEPTAVRLGHDGNPVIAGYAESGGGAEDVTVAAYDADGWLRWSRRSQGLGYLGTRPTVGIDADGNVYVAGSGQYATPDVTVLKYQPNGALAWSARYDGPAGKDDYASASIVSPSGDTYVTGSSVAAAWDYDLTTWKYSSTGTLQWVRRHARPNCPQTNRLDRGVAACLTADGDVVVTGSTGPCAVGIVTIRYAPDGTMRWTAEYSAPAGSVIPSAMNVNGAGIFVLGASSGGAGVLLKYEQTGQLAWSREIAPSQPSASLQDGKVVLGPDGDVHVCMTESHALGARWLVASYDAAGAERWRSVQYDDAGAWNQPAAICNGAGGVVYVTGTRQQDSATLPDFATVLFDEDGTRSWEAGYDGGHADRATDITKGADGVYVVGRVGFAVGSAHAMLKYLDPQPLAAADEGGALSGDPRVSVRGGGAVVRVEFDVRRAQQVRLSFYDVMGRRIAEAAGRYLAPGRQAIELDSRSWPAGIVFLCSASDDGSTFRKKIVLVR